MTINDSQSVAERAIPVKGSTTGKDAQSYRKEKADCSLSEGMIGDEYVLSPGVRYSLTVENRKACYRFEQLSIRTKSFSIKHARGCSVFYSHSLFIELLCGIIRTF